MTHPIDPARLGALRQAYATRRVPLARFAALDPDHTGYRPGDLVLARVDEIGQHGRIELTCGRRAILFPGAELVLACGDRYAPDQFEGRSVQGPGPAQLIAAGGIAGHEEQRHDAMKAPTAITVLGVVRDAAGAVINVADHAISPAADRPEVPVIVVCGTSMNSGKTFTTAHIAHGLTRMGRRAAALKLTGTGAGGDPWRFRDAGAAHVADFTDAGMATTYRMGLARIETGAMALIADAAARTEVIVAEVADGLRMADTAALLTSPRFQARLSGVVFCAGDAMGAEAGVAWLRAAGLPVRAVSGLVARAPLGLREAAEATGLPTLTPPALLDEGVLDWLLKPGNRPCPQPQADRVAA